MVVLVVLLLAGLVILVIGYWSLARGRAAEKRLGVPVGSIRAADVGVKVPLNSRVEKTLISNKYQAKGKPDYITGERDEFVPIEVKSARVRQPRESDEYQLLTQCFLSEEEGRSVSRGRLVYANKTFDISYGPRERQKVLQVLEEMRKVEKLPLKDIPGKQDYRCKGCAYRTLCRVP
ncbi:MAG: CRISPR-associated protein Cas4 [Syntrophales bacterium]